MDKEAAEELTGELNQELQNDEQLASYGLKARVYDKGLVRVQGIVDVLDEKRQAEDLIWRFPGVKMVENNITVCTDGPVDDGDVAFEVSEELRANPEIPDSVGVRVSGGEAHLVGNVSSYNEMVQASEAAGKARGVREVHSELKIADEVDDTTLVNNIQDALMTDLGINPGKVRVTSDHGIVTLQGWLPVNIAGLTMQLTMRQPGVRGVNDELNKDQDRVEVDDKIVIKVMNRIADNPYLNDQPIDIEVEEGKIVLSGEVDSREARKDIEAIIRNIAEEFKPEILAVENNLRMKAEES